MFKKMTLPVEKIRDENLLTKTFFFKGKLNAKPGQFIMLGIPGEGEKPFSISGEEAVWFSITIKKVGEFTEKIFNLKTGDLLSIRGPYGSHFKVQGEKICIASGGVGMAPLLFLLESLLKNKKDVTVINGAKTKNELLFIDRIKNFSSKSLFVTEDGTFGNKGLVTDSLLKLLEKERFDIILGAGPEMMLIKILSLSCEFNTSCELSLERYMKCGIGLCGGCIMDPLGLRICKEGPVLKKETLLKLTEFGKYKRDSSGSKIFFYK